MAAESPPRGGQAAFRPADLDTRAQWAWLTGRVGEAIDLYLDLARVYKGFPHAHFKLGFLYLTAHDPRNAARHFSTAIAKSTATSSETSSLPSDGADAKTSSLSSGSRSHSPRIFLICAHVGRREACMALGETEAAENDRLFVVNRGGGTLAALLAMGTLFCDLGMLQRAEECFDQCAELDAGNPSYLVAHADLCLAQKRHTRAEGLFEKCRVASHSSSSLFHRALIGQGTALLRSQKLQDAAVLLLQAMNSLRVLVRDGASAVDRPDALSSLPTNRQDGAQWPGVADLYHQATNLYGGVCLLLGNLKAALDTFASFARYTGPQSRLAFNLPMICVLPGTRDAHGEMIDSSKLTVANLAELVRHLDEVEWRYGPDPCVYFHRANAHRALGELHQFVHDLSMVEMMEPDFMKTYLSRDCFGDFLDVETISWLPVRVVESIHQSIEKGEYKPPLTSTGLAGRPHSAIGALGRRGKKQTQQRPTAVFSESAIYDYFQQRVDHRLGLDEYAQVYQLDALRRLPLSRARQSERRSLDHLSDWEGAELDKRHRGSTTMQGEIASRVAWCREMVKAALGKHGQHPFVHMAAGMMELELCNASIAQLYFTEALEKIDRRQKSVGSSSASPRLASLASSWQQSVLMRMKYYCLVWRSMASRLRIEMEHAVEDLNVAAAIKLSTKASGTTDPLLIAQRSLIMLFNGHLKAAHKLLRLLERRVRVVLRQQLAQRSGTADGLGDHIAVSVVDMLSNAGLNSFHLLPATVEREFRRLPSAHALLARPVDSSKADASVEETGHSSEEEHDEDAEVAGTGPLKVTKIEEERAVAIVKNTLGKRAAAPGMHASTVLQTETLDKFFEMGLKKLAHTGRLEQAIPYFLAALLVDENYLPPSNFASLELFKCKEHEFAEEKLFNCFVQLGKRSRWLSAKLGWRFEAMVDANLAHAYLPTDLDTLWHRAQLLQDSHNYVSAINDLSGCLDLVSAHMAWQQITKKRGRTTAVFPNETKRTQWLQLLLGRGQLEMATSQWEEAIGDFTLLIDQAGKNNRALQISGFESRSASLIHLRRYAHAVHDLQQQRALVKKRSEDGERLNPGSDVSSREADVMTLLLIGNLYCQLALDQIQQSSSASQKAAPGFNPFVAEQLNSLHRNAGFLQRAAEFFLEARALMPSHFLVHFCLGRMFAISRQPRLAIDSLSESLRHQPLFLPAIFLRGCIYAQEQLIYLGLADLYRVRHRAPAYRNLHSTIGYCHFQRGDMTKAVKSLTEALEHDPSDVDALYMRGCALQELFVLANAEKEFTQVLRVQENHPRALYQRGVCATLRQQYGAAVADLDVLIRLEPEWPDAWIFHAYASFCLKRFDSAILSYSHAIGLYDGGRSYKAQGGADISRLYMHRAFARLQSGKLQGAFEDLKLAVKRDNTNAVAFLAKAYLLMQTSEQAKAAPVLLHALQYAKRLTLLPASDLKVVVQSVRRSSVASINGFFVGHEATAQSLGDAHKSTATSPSRHSVTYTMRPETNAVSESQQQSGRGTTPSVIFRKRKEERESELSRHLGTTNTPSSRARVSDSHVQTGSASPTKLKLVRGGAQAVAVDEHQTSESHGDTDPRRSTRCKIVRVIKRMMFEHRVLKALKAAASSKHRRNQQSVRALADALQPVSSVAWPRGTQTTNALVWAYNTLGIHQFGERKVDDALMAFTLAMQADSSAALTCFNRGNVYLHLNVLHSSVSGFQDAIEVDEGCFQAYNNLGVAFYHLDRLEEAHEAFAAGLHRAGGGKDKAVLLYNLGVTCQVQDKPEEAVELYQRAIQLDGSRVEFFNNRSSILHQQMKFTVALEDYNRALNLPGMPAGGDSQPSSIEALLNRAQLFISMGSCANATQDLKAALKALVHLRNSQDPAPRHCSSSQGTPTATGTSRPGSRERFGPEDEQLVSNLLVFCEQWRRALQIAVDDVLFALESFPFFAKYQLGSVAESAQREAIDGGGDMPYSSQVFALPIEDETFFSYVVDMKPWIEASAQGESPTDVIAEGDAEDVEFDRRSADHTPSDGSPFLLELFRSPLADDLTQACGACATGEFDAAARWLLRAHYKTNIDSHEEYAIMLWRTQVALQVNHKESNNLAAVVRQLREFLLERQSPGEAAFADAYDSGSTVKRARTYSAHFDDDGEPRSQREVQWLKQKRAIRADAFAFLGGLSQLNGQASDARAAFAHALHLRSDHVFALLNFLQLCILSGDHEAALGSIVRLLEIVSSPDHSASPPVLGLLDADRSVSVMVAPAFESLGEDEAIAGCSNQLLQTVKEYRGLVTAHIESNRSLILRKQGVLARKAQELREAFVAASAAASRAKQTEGQLEASTLQLETLDSLVDEYTARIVASPGDFTAQQSYEAFNAAFEDEFARVCEQILESLPEEARAPAPAPASNQEPNASSLNEDSQVTGAEAVMTVQAAGSPRSQRRSTTVARPATTSLNARRHTRAPAGGRFSEDKALVADSVDKTTLPRPQRPQSGLITAQRRRTNF